MSSPPQASHRGGDNPNSMVMAPAGTSVIQNANGAAAAVPTFAGADMVVGAQIHSFVPSLSPEAPRRHGDVQTSAGDESVTGAQVPSSEDAAMSTNTHVASERMIEGSTNPTSTGATMKHPSTMAVSASDTIASQAEVSY
jgi:hypothetical protein